jgi:hypothetical protein
MMNLTVDLRISNIFAVEFKNRIVKAMMCGNNHKLSIRRDIKIKFYFPFPEYYVRSLYETRVVNRANCHAHKTKFTKGKEKMCIKAIWLTDTDTLQ